MNRSTWASRYRRLGRDATFLLLSWPLSLLAFCLVLPLTALGTGTVIIWVGLMVLVLALSIAGGFANLARLAVARLDGREPVPGGYLEPEPGTSLHRMILRRLRDPQRWVDLLWVIVFFPVSLVSWILTVVWLAAAVGGLLGPIADVITESILGDQRNGLSDLLGLYPPLLWDVVIDLTVGVIFMLTAPFVLRGLAAMQAGLIRGMLSWRSEVSRLQTSRAAVQRAEADTRRRLERDIHDGPQQRLVRLRMDLARAQRQAEKDPVAASAIIQGAMDQTQQTLDELRQLSRGIAPPVLVDRGLAAAITEAATRSSVPVTVSTELSEDLPDHVSQAAYFVISESLANLNKHSGATAAAVEARVADGVLHVTVSDNGIGGASTAKGHGLAGLVERLNGVDGRLALMSPAGGPTTVEAMIPCAF
ncbi:sensor histidine kinase [Actinomyces viscosus]|uniref:histidine kinase n=1 Tax=Actinomyces viscosus TaxID=1656 RepID=A0A3S4Z8V2_ACTVI|nr:sensor domain-containing protein [Actinomyces viscosus]TFH53813.1 sensor histidine kinase [Actinomyces viscosus]VEI16216.1 Oxygen sensor histidine kinase nreB [Actinomyces viscosus]